MGRRDMNRPEISLKDVLDGLLAEDLVPAETKEQADTLIAHMRSIQPWYIRTMVGFGAWLASLLLIGFVGGIGFAAEGGYIITGLVMMAAAIAVRRNNQTDFLVQSSLAVSLAGQALFAFGVADLTNTDEFELTLTVVIITSIVLFVVFPDRIHRVLSILIASSSLMALFYAWEWNAAVPLLGPAFAAAMVYLHQRQAAFATGGRGAMMRPLMNGLMLSAFGCLMLSTIYVLPELIDDYVFYPRPWISTLILGGLFIFLGTRVWPQLLGSAHKAAAFVVYGLMLLLIVAAWAAPGLLLALIVVLMGAASGSRMHMGAGVAFLALFVATYFYGIDISMMQKSATLITTGVATLIARWLMLGVLAQATDGGTDND